jgi:hypothetical protein
MENENGVQKVLELKKECERLMDFVKGALAEGDWRKAHKSAVELRKAAERLAEVCKGVKEGALDLG